jgi:hypothetical protein
VRREADEYAFHSDGNRPKTEPVVRYGRQFRLRMRIKPFIADAPVLVGFYGLRAGFCTVGQSAERASGVSAHSRDWADEL